MDTAFILTVVYFNFSLFEFWNCDDMFDIQISNHMLRVVSVIGKKKPVTPVCSSLLITGALSPGIYSHVFPISLLKEGPYDI